GGREVGGQGRVRERERGGVCDAEHEAALLVGEGPRAPSVADDQAADDLLAARDRHGQQGGDVPALEERGEERGLPRHVRHLDDLAGTESLQAGEAVRGEVDLRDRRWDRGGRARVRAQSYGV